MSIADEALHSRRPVPMSHNPEPPARGRWLIGAIVSAGRPKQWTKNLLLFAPLLFTLDQKHSLAEYERCYSAFVIFCMLSASTYMINDIVDYEEDRHHPKKRFRPIASGDLSPKVAMLVASILAVGGLFASYKINTSFLLASGTYFVLTVAYSLKLKHVVLIDLLVLASGFVLRAVAGARAIDVGISSWLILCTMLLALFLGIAKRRAELMAVLSGRKVGRVVISEYSAELLDQMSMIVTSSLLMSYTLYTIQSEAASRHHYLLATIPFVLYGIFRYLYLIHKRSLGESPDEVLVKDKPLIVCVALWSVVTAVIITHHF